MSYFMILRMGIGAGNRNGKIEVAEPSMHKPTHFLSLFKIMSSDSYFLTMKIQSGTQSMVA